MYISPPTPTRKPYSLTKFFRQHFCLNIVQPVVLTSYFLQEAIQWVGQKDALCFIFA